jgi:perosamine synthetase
MMRIPLARPDLRGNEERYVVQALRSSWISSTGPFLTRFESEFAELCNARTSLAVCNGTVALHLALLTLDVRPSDEVIIPSLTYVATANAVKYVGGEPAFVDVDPATWCIDPKMIELAITPRTKGIIAVHLYGHPADMDAINDIAAAHGLWVVEDAAEAPLALYKGRPTGGLAKVGTFSFYGNKVFSSGEGGAMTLSDPDLEARARMLRGQGMDPQRRYFFPIVGHNFRLTNVACALLCAQLERREEMLARRRQIADLYRSFLSSVPGINFQPTATWAIPSPWLFSIMIDERVFGRTRDQIMAELATQGIETRPFFIPLHTLPPYHQLSKDYGDNLIATDRIARSGLNLPTSSAMSDLEVKMVAQALLGLAPRTFRRKTAPAHETGS